MLKHGMFVLRKAENFNLIIVAFGDPYFTGQCDIPHKIAISRELDRFKNLSGDRIHNIKLLQDHIGNEQVALALIHGCDFRHLACLCLSAKVSDGGNRTSGGINQEEKACLSTGDDHFFQHWRVTHVVKTDAGIPTR